MAVIQMAKTSHYTTIANSALEDTRISWQARGLLAFLLSKPSTWEINVQHLIDQGPTGRDGVYRILNELERHGYLRKQAVRAQGKYQGTRWIVYEDPSLAERDDSDNLSSSNPPRPETPDTDKPDSGKRDGGKSQDARGGAPGTEPPDPGPPDTETPDPVPYPEEPVPENPDPARPESEQSPARREGEPYPEAPYPGNPDTAPHPDNPDSGTPDPGPPDPGNPSPSKEGFPAIPEGQQDGMAVRATETAEAAEAGRGTLSVEGSGEPTGIDEANNAENGAPARTLSDVPDHPAVARFTNPASREDVQEVFGYWQQRLGKAGATLDRNRREVIEARLREGVPVATMKAAVDGVLKSPWHRGENDQGVRYDRIKTVFRDTDTVEWLAEIGQQAGPDRKRHGSDDLVARFAKGEKG